MVTTDEAAAPPVSVEDVRSAAALLNGIVRPTPMEFSRAISARAGCDVFLKCENLQRAGSFKIRGAYTRMSRLSDEAKSRGVVAASAGNHAQGVALAGQLLGITSTVFMPVGAPVPKLTATLGYGATVKQVGHSVDDCLGYARQFAADTGAVLIHPFDHCDIVAGAGTCGLEIVDQCPDVETIVVGTGGGGLLAGITVAVKGVRPDVRVIGVQAVGAAAYPASLAAGRPTALETMSTMADGIAVGRPGDVPFSIISSLTDAIETVSEESLSRALLFLLERAKLVTEPAGAASVGHLLDAGPGRYPGPVVAVLSGGNIDPLLLMQVIRHGMAAAGRYLQFRVRVPDRPGSLARLLDDLAAAEANVLDVEHVRTGFSLQVGEVEIGVQAETKGADHCNELLSALAAKGYQLLLD